MIERSLTASRFLGARRDADATSVDASQPLENTGRGAAPGQERHPPAGPVFDAVIANLHNDRPIAYTKLNHGFWERLVEIERLVGTFGAFDESQARELDRLTVKPLFLEGQFLQEFLDLYRETAPRLNDVLFAISYYAWPDSDVIEGTPYAGKASCQRMIDRLTPAGLNRAGDGLEFKRAAINGEFKRFADALRGRPLLILGPKTIAALPEFLGHSDATFLPIHRREARGARDEIFAEVCRVLDGPGPSPVVLMQAGSLAMWLIIKLRERFAEATLLDVGAALNICNIPLLTRQNWAKVYRQPIASTITQVRPDWSTNADAYSNVRTAEKRQSVWTTLSIGRDGGLVALAERAGCARPEPFLPEVASSNPVAFIENKTPDYHRVRQIMALSERKNAFANAGPVSRLLEDAITRLTELPAGQRAIAVSNATSGLHALAGLEAIRRGRHLRWISSAFTFFAANTGPLAETALVDCNASGVIDRTVLERLDPDSFDGVVYTNVFAANSDIGDLAAFCAEHDKALIVDNATGLLDAPVSGGRPPPQVISCHHTKPWGFGEGGIVVVDEADETLTRQLINFANGAPDWARRYGSNGKVSDAACAFILERIERMVAWGDLYRMQLRRVMALIEQNELPLSPLWGALPTSPVSSIPLLAPQPISPQMLVNKHLVLRKYYRPLNWSKDDVLGWNRESATYPTAEDIFRRIVNFPAHPDMVALDDHSLVEVLHQLSSAAVREDAALK